MSGVDLLHLTPRHRIVLLGRIDNVKADHPVIRFARKRDGGGAENHQCANAMQVFHSSNCSGWPRFPEKYTDSSLFQL